MFQGVGEPFDAELVAMDLFNVFYTTLEAFAGNPIDITAFEQGERFYLPGIQGKHIAFHITGNSMSPTITDGDMVLCRFIEGINQVKDNDIYAVVMRNSVVVKRVQKIMDETNTNCIHLRLISDNYIEHLPFEVEIEEVRYLLQVTRRLTGFGKL
jgi:phage repressor protein C with HTH and peptisase S24 domain